ncbi:MAG: hypothetical protein JO287_02650 [Pseudonocardiales bacterium]|nr:hypothetical protein [Pseudonocardiales bacterium]
MAPKRPVHLVQSEVWLDRTEFEDLIRQRVPETAKAPRYPAIGTKTIEVRPLVGRPSRVSSVAPLFAPVPAIVEDGGLIRLDGLEPAQVEAANRPSVARSRRFPRWAVAGVLGLAVAGSAVAVPLLTSDGAAKVTAAKAAPAKSVPAIPSPGSGDARSGKPIEAGQVAAPNPPEDVTVRSASASVPAPHPARSDNRSTATPKHADSATTPSPASQIAANEIDKWWSQAVAAYGPRNPRWTHSSPDSPPWP